MRRLMPLATHSLLNTTPQPSMGFAATVNPYRGCAHACAYCYARDTHAYLGLDPAEGFSRDIRVKQGCAAALLRDLRRPGARDGVIAVGTATDPYQSVEGRQQNTRQVVRLLVEAGCAFTLTTKSPLVVRDADLIGAAARQGRAAVHISLISLDADLLRRLEPGSPPPHARLAAMRRLAEENIPVGLFVAPVLPMLTDGLADLERLMSAAARAGATWAMVGPLRLPGASRDVLLACLRRHWPRLAPAYEGLYARGRADLPWPVRQSLLERGDRARRLAGLSDRGPRLTPRPDWAQTVLGEGAFGHATAPRVEIATVGQAGTGARTAP
jgi:DNA repair photolyase